MGSRRVIDFVFNYLLTLKQTLLTHDIDLKRRNICFFLYIHSTFRTSNSKMSFDLSVLCMETFYVHCYPRFYFRSFTGFGCLSRSVMTDFTTSTFMCIQRSLIWVSSTYSTILIRSILRTILHNMVRIRHFVFINIVIDYDFVFYSFRHCGRKRMNSLRFSYTSLS